MGFDISYHPITENEIKRWYFDVLYNTLLIDRLGEEYNIEEFYVEKYKDTIDVASNTDESENFDSTHGYYLAVIQGFVRKYFYVRGAAFSFLIENEPAFAAYTADWGKIIPLEYGNPRVGRLITNYSSGVYMSSGQVKQLLEDFNSKPSLRQKLTDFYSHGRIDVFISALNYASDNNLGLLEATEVIEPNPLDLNKSTCYSNLFNCDKAGPLLYQEAALEQLRNIEEQSNAPESEPAGDTEYKNTGIKEKERAEDAEGKKSLWKKLFGK